MPVKCRLWRSRAHHSRLDGAGPGILRRVAAAAHLRAPARRRHHRRSRANGDARVGPVKRRAGVIEDTV